MFFGELPLSTGSAFFYEHHGKSYIVTNRHNLTGKHQVTGQALHSQGALPDRLKFVVPAFEQVKDMVYFGKALQEFEIKWTNDSQPWLEHPLLGPAADVVALDVQQHWPKAPKPFVHANTIPGSLPICLQPALRVSVVGYPFGQAVAEHYPVWVSGSIASEPEFDADGKPAMFIDCRTNRGSSGSPVFAYIPTGLVELDSLPVPPPPMHMTNPDGTVAAMFPKPVSRFIGIYSGRISDNADIGLVWRNEVIAETCAKGRITQLGWSYGSVSGTFSATLSNR
jgi:Trypsin-like peptidase domain